MAGGPSGAPRASFRGVSRACMTMTTTTVRMESMAEARAARVRKGGPRGLIGLPASSRAAPRLPGSRPAPAMAAASGYALCVSKLLRQFHDGSR